MNRLTWTNFEDLMESFGHYVWHGEGNGTPLQYSCLENPMGGGAWWATVHRVTKSRTRLSDFTLTFHSHALEKEMATHSSVLAWRIPGTGEPGGLLSLGSQSRTRLKRLSSSSMNSKNLWPAVSLIFISWGELTFWKLKGHVICDMIYFILKSNYCISFLKQILIKCIPHPKHCS